MRSSLTFVLRIVVLEFLLLACCALPSDAQPNIIHMVADDLGWTDLGTNATNNGNGSAFYQTPNIDALAVSGMSFTSAYALQTCVPTRVSLLTGQYPTTSGVYSVESLGGGGNQPLVGAANSTVIDNAAITIGETLQSSGYTTAHFGKFHVTRNANAITAQHGFDFDYGGGTTGGPSSYFAASGEFSSATGPELDAYAASYTQAYIDQNLKPYANGADVDSLLGTAKHLTDAMADAAIDFMKGQLAGTGEPFYMNVAFNAVHTPIESRPDLQAKYDGIVAANGGVSPDSRHDDTAYAGLLEGMDQAIGRIIDFVQDPDGDGNSSDSIADNTVVFFYGDNGGFAGATDNTPLRGAKGSQYEGGLRVPLIAWSPGRIAAGTSSDEQIHSVDFYPTFAELAGATLPEAATHRVEGESLVGLLTGASTETFRDAIYFHFPGYQGANEPSSTINLDSGANRVKLMYFYENRGFEFYDLNNDIGESNNLADGNMTVHEYKLAARAVSSLRDWLEETGALYPTVTADGTLVPPPSHLPSITFDIDSSFDGLESAQKEMLGIRLELQATGTNALLDANEDGTGVASDLDTGGPNQRRRINGSYSTPETIQLSFDEDVYLKALLLDAISTNGSELVTLEFVSGDNPFDELQGYNADDGFTLGSDSLSYSASTSNATEHLLEFGILGREELFLTAGTVLSLTADPAEGGGVLLNSVSVAQPLSAAVSIALDYNLDGIVDAADYAVWKSTFGSTSDLRADGNGDGVVDMADYAVWRNYLGTSQANLNLNSVATVPEPASHLSAVFLAIFLATIFRFA